MSKQRAIGITRVSQEGDREVIHSYATQAARIKQDCEREGVELIYVGQERNVSGGANLANRPELSKAVAAVEAGEAELIVAAYFDRFFRSLEVQAEVIGRIERAGGEILALDHGRLTNGTPANRLQANIVGAMSQFFREQTAEKSAAGVAEAVALGRTPWARIPLGYTRQNGTLSVDEATKPIVERVFAMRAEAASTSQIRQMLKEHGVSRSSRGVQIMFSSRVYLGEIHFGKMVNLKAHEPIVDRELFDRVQRTVVSRGRKSKSERLLARQRILRCGACGGRMSVTSAGSARRYSSYRCESQNCAPRLCIGAEIAERVVSDAVRAALADAEGRASIAENAQEAASALERAQRDLDTAMRSFAAAGLENESAAVERLVELRQARDVAQERVDQIGTGAARTVNAAGDWDELSLAGRRELIRATVESAIVAPTGRGAERIAVRLLGQ
jgi:site-specific DNA recombinase